MLSPDDFDFSLPPELIAQQPAAERSASRLLHLAGGERRDLGFRDLPGLIDPGDLLVFNDTEVMRARLFGEKASGGKVEVLIERLLDSRQALAQIRASKSPRPGSRLWLADAFAVEVKGRAGTDGQFFHLELVGSGSLAERIDAHGQLPLPPYITHAPDSADETRYQTVFARAKGAVAAPTAGLHFDAPLLAALKERGVNTAALTLHVGAGTFTPVRAARLADHRMHSEIFVLPEATRDAVRATRAAGGKVCAVGTTSLRALEAAAASGELVAGAGETDIFITPGYRFRVVDRLITNFHLPKSTLFMLVAAFAGLDDIRAAYAHAIAQRYRFFSYGDAMLLERNHHAI